MTIGPQVPLSAFRAYTIEGDVVAAGTGMRNGGAGTITLALPEGATVLRAFLYWAIIAPTQPSAAGTLNGSAIAGTLIAQAGAPCWPDFNTAAADPPTLFTWVHRADVSSVVVDGDNALAGFPSGLTGGEDALANASAFPLLDGATLVVVYTDAVAGPTRTIVLYDGGETFFDETSSVTMSLGAMPAVAPVDATTTFVVADGQSFFEGDGAIVDDVEVAGPGAALRPADAFDGTDGGGPAEAHGVWDTLEVDVSHVIDPGQTSISASVVSDDEGDCLTWVAQVASVVVAVPPTTTSTSTSMTTTSFTTSSLASTTSTSATSTTSSTSQTTTTTSTSTSTSLQPATTTSTSTSSTTTSTSTTLPCAGLGPFAEIVCRFDLLAAEVRASEGERGIGKRLLKQLTKGRNATLKAESGANASKKKKILGGLRKAERACVAFARKVRSLSGKNQIAHPDPERLASTADALRAQVLALRETFR